LFDLRPTPSILYFYLKYFGFRSTILSTLINLPFSVVPYRFKNNKLVSLLYFPKFILLLPFLIYSVIKSWSMASSMLKEGGKIINLK
jgi:hypothetical protein